MNAKIISIILLLVVITTACSEKLTPEEEEARREEARVRFRYCNQFETEDTCDLELCEWDLAVKCAVPGSNCGVAYTGRPECINKD